MKFVAGDTGIAGSIQMRYKIIHEIKKVIFMNVVVRTV